ASREVDPLLSRISSEQRGQSKCKGDSEASVSRIKRWGMYGHLGILQQRIEAASIGTCRQMQNPSSTGGRKHSERTGDKIVHSQEKNLNARQDHADVRHQFRVLPAVGKQDRKHINRKQETPEEQRTFLARPKRRKFVIGGKGSIAVGGDIGQRIIIGEKQVPQAADSNPNKDANREAGIPRGFNQERAASAKRGDASEYCIKSEGKSQEQRIGTEQIQFKSSIPGWLPVSYGITRNQSSQLDQNSAERISPCRWNTNRLLRHPAEPAHPEPLRT